MLFLHIQDSITFEAGRILIWAPESEVTKSCHAAQQFLERSHNPRGLVFCRNSALNQKTGHYFARTLVKPVSMALVCVFFSFSRVGIPLTHSWHCSNFSWNISEITLFDVRVCALHNSCVAHGQTQLFRRQGQRCD